MRSAFSLSVAVALALALSHTLALPLPGGGHAPAQLVTGAPDELPRITALPLRSAPPPSVEAAGTDAPAAVEGAGTGAPASGSKEAVRQLPETLTKEVRMKYLKGYLDARPKTASGGTLSVDQDDTTLETALETALNGGVPVTREPVTRVLDEAPDKSPIENIAHLQALDKKIADVDAYAVREMTLSSSQLKQREAATAEREALLGIPPAVWNRAQGRWVRAFGGQGVQPTRGDGAAAAVTTHRDAAATATTHDDAAAAVLRTSGGAAGAGPLATNPGRSASLPGSEPQEVPPHKGQAPKLSSQQRTPNTGKPDAGSVRKALPSDSVAGSVEAKADGLLKPSAGQRTGLGARMKKFFKFFSDSDLMRPR